MGVKLYVGNLPIDITEEAIRQTFAKAGAVTSVVLTEDRNMLNSRRSAYVHMSSPKEAQSAILTLDGLQLEDGILTVRRALPSETPIPYHNRSRPRRGY